jgi:hypothetical protein
MLREKVLGNIMRSSAMYREERKKGLALACKNDAAVFSHLNFQWQRAMSVQASFVSGSGSLRDYSDAALFLAELDSFYRTGSPNVLD